jgi:hypothetical protein
MVAQAEPSQLRENRTPRHQLEFLLMEKKLKHLEFVQAVIARLSNHSFLFKGWSITVAGALFAFAVVNDRKALVAIALVTSLLFWGLDGYYLWLERGYIELHERVAKSDEADINFSMRIDKSNAIRRWLKTCIRPHLLVFYGSIVAVEIVGILVVKRACGP